MSNRFTEKAEKALNNAAKMAESLGHTYIGSEHILLSIAKDKTSTATAILIKNNESHKQERHLPRVCGFRCFYNMMMESSAQHSS